jgi:hypothetical protein
LSRPVCLRFYFLLGKLDSLGDDVDAEAMEVLNELNLLSESGERQEFKNEHSEWKKGG